jgi:hypothetical protein
VKKLLNFIFFNDRTDTTHGQEVYNLCVVPSKANVDVVIIINLTGTHRKSKYKWPLWKVAGSPNIINNSSCRKYGEQTPIPKFPQWLFTINPLFQLQLAEKTEVRGICKRIERNSTSMTCTKAITILFWVSHTNK